MGRRLRHSDCRRKAIAQETAMSTHPDKHPGDEVTPDTDQTGTLPCERCGGTGRLETGSCPDCGGTGEVVVNVGDA
jgi:RecJ-like exonuclease